MQNADTPRRWRVPRRIVFSHEVSNFIAKSSIDGTLDIYPVNEISRANLVREKYAANTPVTLFPERTSPKQE